MAPLKYISNFSRALEMSLVNCEISLPLKWSRNCIIVAATAKNNKNTAIKINDTKIYVPVVSLSYQENLELLEQLESSHKRTIEWSKYLSKTTNQERNRYLDNLIDPSFQGRNSLFLSFEDDDGQKSNKQYYLSTVKIKDYNVMINGRNFFDQPISENISQCSKKF